MEIHIGSLVLGAFAPYLVVFAIRAAMIIPAVIRDVTKAIWATVRQQTA